MKFREGDHAGCRRGCQNTCRGLALTLARASSNSTDAPDARQTLGRPALPPRSPSHTVIRGNTSQRQPARRECGLRIGSRRARQRADGHPSARPDGGEPGAAAVRTPRARFPAPRPPASGARRSRAPRAFFFFSPSHPRIPSSRARRCRRGAGGKAPRPASRIPGPLDTSNRTQQRPPGVCGVGWVLTATGVHLGSSCR